MKSTAKKVRTSVAAPARTESENSGENSHFHPSTLASRCQGSALAELLESGAHRGVHAAEISARTGRTARRIRQVVNAERRRGVPILSDPQAGYYLPSSQQEVLRCVRFLRAQAGELEEIAAALLEVL